LLLREDSAIIVFDLLYLLIFERGAMIEAKHKIKIITISLDFIIIMGIKIMGMIFCQVMMIIIGVLLIFIILITFMYQL